MRTAGALLVIAIAACGDNQPGAFVGTFFTNLRVEANTGDRAVLRFETAIPTSCHAIYGRTSNALDAVATDPDMAPGTLVTDHTVPLENLAPLTTFYFRAVAKDAGGTSYTSGEDSLTTTAGDAVLAMTNIARASMGTKVTAVSSNWSGGANDSEWGINHVIDADMYTEWSSDGDGDVAYVVLDFGQPRTVSYFGFRSRKMRDGTSIIQRVRLSFDGGATVLGPFDTPDPDHRYAFELAAPATARTVRVEAVATTGGNTGAKEIQFFEP